MCADDLYIVSKFYRSVKLNLFLKNISVWLFSAVPLDDGNSAVMRNSGIQSIVLSSAILPAGMDI